MYYHFANVTNQKINIIREATVDEYKVFEENSKPLCDYLFDKKRINSIETTFEKIISIVDEFKIREVDYTDIEEINTLFTTYLSLFKKFLDNWETQLKRKHGKTSSQVEHFKKVTAYEYDNYMEYRIFYRLRNYDQHCGNLLTNMSKEINEDGTISVHIQINRDYLLNNFDEWKKEEKEFLNNQNEYIKVMPLFKTFHKCVQRIHINMLQIHYSDSFFDSCYNIICIASEFKDEDSISFIRTDKQITKEIFEQGKIKFSIISCQVPICKEILRIFLKSVQINFLIVSYGECMNNKLKSISTVINDEKTAEIIKNNTVVNISDTTMLIDTKIILIDKNSFYAILVKKSFYNQFKKTLLDRITRYFKLFTKEKIPN